MGNEAEEIQVSYFVLCDHVISEAQTGKQSLIGIYSALFTEQLPMHMNLAVGFGVRVQSARTRHFLFRITGPDGALQFSSPPLQCDWNAIANGLQNTGFATVQFGLNLRSMPFATAGVYTAAIYCEDRLLATYPVSVVLNPPPASPTTR